MARPMEAPEGWKISLLDSVTKRGSGHTPDKEHPEYWNGGIKWVSLADSHRLDAGTIWETDKEISELGIAKSSAVVHPSGTVILSRDAGVGKSAVLDGDMAVSQHFIAWRCSSSLGLHNWFLYTWLQFNKREFERQAVGSTIKTIGLPYFKRLQICYPPYAEQSAIVDIIRTWDRAIETVEALIANARAQKQALMQQLLPQGTTQPKKRLPGFSGEWREAKLGSQADISKGEQKGRASLAEEGPVPVINGGITPSGYTDHPNTAANTITISEGGNSCGHVDLITQSFWCGGHCYALKNLKVDRNYLFAVLKHRQLEIMSLRVGSGLPNIQKKALSQFSIPVPTKPEQEKIGELAASADKEIAALEAQLTALRQEKAALMQQLLTGKRRVKLPESEVA